jgi:predicted ATPase
LSNFLLCGKIPTTALNPNEFSAYLLQIPILYWQAFLSILDFKEKMDITPSVGDIKAAALRPSVVKHFSIEGLFGYRSISLDSKYAATVLIARNGSGKTTLLGALDAFLRGQFTRLANLDFQSISCSIEGIPEIMQISKAQIDELMEICTDAQFMARAKTWEIEPHALLEIMELDFDGMTNAEVLDHPVFSTLYTKISYDIGEAKIRCKRIAEPIRERTPQLNRIRDLLSSALSDFEIVYLPTYRRIELSIPSVESRSGRRKKSILARLGVSQRGLHTGDINFGLSDISDRLAALYRDIQFQSNQGYGKVSANIINDLVTGAFDQSVPELNARPSKDALQIFFERIKDIDREYRYGPYNSVRIPDIDTIYSDSVPAESKKFLNYFLGQLNSVIQKTQNIESTVEQFIANCNKYLSGDDFSTKTKGAIEGMSDDDKVLTFNKRNLRVTVSSRRTNRKIPLDALSSGEKQMISLFAQLYLYPKKKLVLIDEPELSLSLDWQRKILPDILSSSTCQQVIAITHSPFIFDNELEPFAASLRLSFANMKVDDLFQGIEMDEGIDNPEDNVDDH